MGSRENRISNPLLQIYIYILQILQCRLLTKDQVLTGRRSCWRLRT
uniref:Uncharacterized protein n=1 Tax=Triticum urartu TaxID=4572 RepID=A0A8R7P506_TRIUA